MIEEREKKEDKENPYPNQKNSQDVRLGKKLLDKGDLYHKNIINTVTVPALSLFLLGLQRLEWNMETRCSVASELLKKVVLLGGVSRRGAVGGRQSTGGSLKFIETAGSKQLRLLGMVLERGYCLGSNTNANIGGHQFDDESSRQSDVVRKSMGIARKVVRLIQQDLKERDGEKMEVYAKEGKRR